MNDLFPVIQAANLKARDGTAMIIFINLYVMFPANKQACD